MWRQTTLAAVIATIAMLAAAAAQGISDKAREAEALMAQGKVIEAIGAFDDATVALWEKAPLSFRRAIWVVEKASGYGAYNPRENAIFDPGAPMLAYAEPIGFGWRQSGEIWRTDLAADIAIKTPDGKTIYHQDDFQKLQLASRVRNREFIVNFTYRLTGLPKGEYALETTLRDQLTGKKGAFTLAFTIR